MRPSLRDRLMNLSVSDYELFREVSEWLNLEYDEELMSFMFIHRPKLLESVFKAH